MKIKTTNTTVGVPCGKCPACIKHRVDSWVFRLNVELREAVSAYFVTLTFNTKNVPLTSRGYMSLDVPVIKQKRNGDEYMYFGPDILQGFLKRLRKMGSEKPIKYYIAGEYGGITNRPHYHAIMFNCDIENVQKAWIHGKIHVGHTVTSDCMAYTLKYICKESKIPLHRNDDRMKEFSVMSKGLGLGYLTPEMIQWHYADRLNRMCCVVEGGRKIAMPRYYKEWLYLDKMERKEIGLYQKKMMEFREEQKRQKIKDYDARKVHSHMEQFRKLKKTCKERDKL